MELAGGNRDHVRQTGGNIPLAVKIFAPRDHSAVGLQRETVLPPGVHGGHVGQPWRDVGLIKTVAAPRDHGSIAPQGQAMLKTGRDGRNVRQPGWNIGLAAAVQAPSDDRTIRLHRQIVPPAGRDSHQVGEAQWYRRLTERIIAPSHQGYHHQDRVRTGQGAEGIAHQDRVAAVRIGRQNIGDGQRACLRTENPGTVGQVGAELLPLVGERPVAAGDDLEADIGQGGDRLALRLHGDGQWRQGQAGRRARDRTKYIADHTAVTASGGKW